MTMRKPKRKREPVQQGEPGKRAHKLMRKWQDYNGPRHPRPFERHKHSRFK